MCELVRDISGVPAKPAAIPEGKSADQRKRACGAQRGQPASYFFGPPSKRHRLADIDEAANRADSDLGISNCKLRGPGISQRKYRPIRPECRTSLLSGVLSDAGV
jgi:hypothetical protein